MIVRAPRDDAAARPSRPELRISSAILNPWPTSPSRSSTGTRTLSNVTVRVSLALIPIFCSGWPSEMPGACASTMNAVTRCFALAVDLDRHLGEHGEQAGVARVRDPDLRAGRACSACRPRSGMAVVVIACASEPEPGSVRQNAAIVSPLAQRGQPALLLVLGAEQRDALAPDGLVRAEVDAERRVRRADLAEHAVEHLRRRAEAAVRLGDVQPHQAELGHPVADRVGEPAVVVELRGCRRCRRRRRGTSRRSSGATRAPRRRGRGRGRRGPRGSRRGRSPW